MEAQHPQLRLTKQSLEHYVTLLVMLPRIVCSFLSYEHMYKQLMLMRTFPWSRSLTQTNPILIPFAQPTHAQFVVFTITTPIIALN